MSTAEFHLRLSCIPADKSKIHLATSIFIFKADQGIVVFEKGGSFYNICGNI